MRRLLPALVVAAALAAGCGAARGNVDLTVVRAWSHALNAGENERAAALFATGARVVQSGTVLTLATRADAVAWNAALPCSGRIVSLRRRGDDVTATFLLGDRPGSACDGPGETATALFRIRHGLIVLWHQLGGTTPSSGPTV